MCVALKLMTCSFLAKHRAKNRLGNSLSQSPASKCINRKINKKRKMFRVLSVLSKILARNPKIAETLSLLIYYFIYLTPKFRSVMSSFPRLVFISLIGDIQTLIEFSFFFLLVLAKIIFLITFSKCSSAVARKEEDL